MLKLIAENWAEFLDFIEGLDTPLSEPQKRKPLWAELGTVRQRGRWHKAAQKRRIIN